MLSAFCDFETMQGWLARIEMKSDKEGECTLNCLHGTGVQIEGYLISLSISLRGTHKSLNLNVVSHKMIEPLLDLCIKIGGLRASHFS